MLLHSGNTLLLAASFTTLSYQYKFNTMNELVKRLATGNHPVQANRPDMEVKALQERIEIGYLHIMFKDTGTELGIKLDKQNCDYSKANFSTGEGTAHFEGCITLNYDKVKCIADIDLKTMEGEGKLVPVDEVEYKRVMA